MTETFGMTREGGAFRVDIDLPLEPDKAREVARLVDDDAGEAKVTLGERRRLRRVTATGLVSPVTMRRILNVLAA